MTFAAAMQDLAAGRLFEALPRLKAAVESQPDNAEYWLGYLSALAQAGHTVMARQLLGYVRSRGIGGEALERFAAQLLAGEPAVPAAPARHFIVVAPPYQRRLAGVRVLHELCDGLNRCGHVAYLLCSRFHADLAAECYVPRDDELAADLTSIPRLPAGTGPDSLRELVDAAIVIYPEVVAGNPLRAGRVVRYVLNHPGSNGYPMMHGERDYIVAFQPMFWPQPHAVATLLFEEPLFNDAGTRPARERGLDCTYVGKGARFGACPKVPGTVQVERDWPADKDGLAALLRGTRYFYTWDVVSQTNLDALCCGAVPVILRLAPFTPQVFDLAWGRLEFPLARDAGGRPVAPDDIGDFLAARDGFLGAYRALARSRPQIIARLAQAMRAHFGA